MFQLGQDIIAVLTIAAAFAGIYESVFLGSQLYTAWMERPFHDGKPHKDHE